MFQRFVLIGAALAALGWQQIASGEESAASPANGQPLTALVSEHADKWTNGATGAARLAKAAGFEVRTLDLMQPLAGQASDVLIFGSFASENPAYREFVARERAALLTFVERGGVVMQFTQADQTEGATPFLAAPASAKRSDLDHPAVVVFDAPEHPLLARLTLDAKSGSRNAALWRLPSHFGRGASWESFSDLTRGRVLASAEPARGFAVLEFAHGRGRVVTTSLFFDKLDDAAGKSIAPREVQAAAAEWFAGLKDYVAAVKSGRAPAVASGDKNQLKTLAAADGQLAKLFEQTQPPPKSDPETPFSKPGDLPQLPEGAFSIAVLPDTQIYAESYPEHFKNQTRWIAANAEKRNIKFALQLGDITNKNTRPQWEVARDSMYMLDGKVPYAIAPGNHDYGPNGNAAKRETFFNEYFPLEKYLPLKTFGDVFEPGRLENCWHEFQVGPQKFLVLVLEWGPRDAAVEWANKVVAAHPEHRVILITHAYMYYDETRYDWKSKGKSQSWNPHSYGTGSDPAGTNDGEELWQKLVRKHKNFIMTLNGHVLDDGLGYLASEGDAGNVVHQMLVNYQMKREGGEGYLQLLEFAPDGETVQVRAFSPSLTESKTDSQNEFVLKLNPPLKLRDAKP